MIRTITRITSAGIKIPTAGIKIPTAGVKIPTVTQTKTPSNMFSTTNIRKDEKDPTFTQEKPSQNTLSVTNTKMKEKDIYRPHGIPALVMISVGSLGFGYGIIPGAITSIANIFYPTFILSFPAIFGVTACTSILSTIPFWKPTYVRGFLMRNDTSCIIYFALGACGLGLLFGRLVMSTIIAGFITLKEAGFFNFLFNNL